MIVMKARFRLRARLCRLHWERMQYDVGRGQGWECDARRSRRREWEAR